MNTFFKLAPLGLALLGAYACGDKSATVTNCPPNQSVSCNCPGTNVPGAQVCLPDGSGFDACNCEGTTSSGPGATTTTGTTTNGVGPSTSTGFPSGGPSTGVGTGSAGGADPNQGACDTGADCNTCQNSECALELCAAQKAACDKNADCKLLFECTTGCDMMDQACMNGCITKYKGGTQALISFITCAACDPGPCSSDCKGFLQCSMN